MSVLTHADRDARFTVARPHRILTGFPHDAADGSHNLAAARLNGSIARAGGSVASTRIAGPGRTLLRTAAAAWPVLSVLPAGARRSARFPPSSPAPAQARAMRCDSPPAPGRSAGDAPFEDRLYDLGRLAPLATGAGVRVAVIDSGVDAEHPQLARPGRPRPRPAARRPGRPAGLRRARHRGGQHHRRPAGRRGRRSTGWRRTPPWCRCGSPRRSRSTARQSATTAPRPSSPRRSTWAADPDGGDADVINLSVVMTDDNARVRRAVAGRGRPRGGGGRRGRQQRRAGQGQPDAVSGRVPGGDRGRRGHRGRGPGRVLPARRLRRPGRGRRRASRWPRRAPGTPPGRAPASPRRTCPPPRRCCWSGSRV